MKKLKLGATGTEVAINLKRLREDQNLSYAALEQLLEDCGHKIPALGLRRIEAHARRVDTDDLMALAVVLGVSPLTLLLPSTGEVAPTEITGVRGDIAANVAWLWATGEEPIELPAVPLSPAAERAKHIFKLTAKPHIHERSLAVAKFVNTPAGKDLLNEVPPLAELQRIQLRG